MMGLVALFTLTAHGGNFVALKTTGDLQRRARALAQKAVWAVLLGSVLALFAVSHIRPAIWDNYMQHPWGFVFPLIGLAGIMGMIFFATRGRDLAAFISSASFISGMGAATAFGLFPNLLPASTDPNFSLTVTNSAAGAHGLQVGLVWWGIGMVLAVAYFSYLFYSFRGKVRLGPEGEGY
ncbi:MAG: hypothetical protein D6743_07585 [Calditrichaeota bacterium]|nr:MAG: hypothetical protein D6743_07585 [Calditrichota bacterium]